MVPGDPVQLDHERRIRRLEDARVSLENALFAMIQIERLHNDRHEQLLSRIEANLAEMGDKLNGLIGWAEGMERKKPPRKRNGHKQG